MRQIHALRTKTQTSPRKSQRKNPALAQEGVTESAFEMGPKNSSMPPNSNDNKGESLYSHMINCLANTVIRSDRRQRVERWSFRI